MNVCIKIKCCFFFGVLVMLGGIINSSIVKAEDGFVSSATITVPIACSMVGTTDVAHTAEIPSGIDSRSSAYYPNGIGQTSLKVYCNDNEGFAVYAVGFSDDVIGNTFLRDSNLGQTADIQTSTIFSGNNSAWAMKLGIASDSGNITDGNAFVLDSDLEGTFGDYHSIPNAYTMVAHKYAATSMDSNNGGATLTATYATYISPAQKTGIYVGQVKYTMVHPSGAIPIGPRETPPGKICYYPNANDAVGIMECQTIPTSGTSNGVSPTSAMLLASNFSREGFGFAGWSTTYDYSEQFGYYGPQETITYDSGQYSGDNPGLSLYATWIRPEDGVFGSDVTMVCNELTQVRAGEHNDLTSVSAFTDERDGQTYAFAKLADGKCWMIENLRLEAEYSDDSSLAQGFGGVFQGLAEPETDFGVAPRTGNSLYYAYSSDDGSGRINIGTSCGELCMPHYNNINTSDRETTRSSNSESMYSYGNYYSWAAAIANTYRIASGDVPTSICPIGWKLPVVNGSYPNFMFLAGSSLPEMQADTCSAGQTRVQCFSGQIASNRMRTFPNNFLYAGNYSGTTLNSLGSSGSYWAATAQDNTWAYRFYVNDSSVYPGTYTQNKNYGFPIRCIFEH